MTLLFDTVQVGAVHNGRQTVTIPDKKKGIYTTVNSTPEKVDEFLTERKNNEKKSEKQQWISLGTGTVLGGLIGTAFKLEKGMSRLASGVGGALFGAAVSLFPILYFAIKGDNQNYKLNEKFIAENQEV